MTSDITRFRDNLRDELNGAALYTALAAAVTYGIGAALGTSLS